MSKRLMVSASALFIMLALLVGGISKLYENREIPKQEEATESSATLPTEETKEVFFLGIEDGVVVVFAENDTTRPIIVTDIYAGTLRNFDREELTRGLRVESELELQQILEDFSS